MAIKSSLWFSYAGVNSSDLGIMNVNINSGMLEEPFLANRTIKEVKIRGNPQAYFQEIEYEPLEFSLSFAFMDTWDEAKIREVARWLGNQSFYRPLWFSDNPDRWFYCMPVESPSLIHNGLSQGYVTINFRCDSPYSYTPVYEKIFDLSSNVANGTNIAIDNTGDIDCLPLLEIKLLNGGGFSITNNSNGGDILSFSGLADNETLTIDNEHETITSDIPLVNRYQNMDSNSKFLRLVYGVNQLNVKGNIQIKFTMQFKTLQG